MVNRSRLVKLIVLCALISACAPKISPNQKPLSYANEVLLRVYELQTTAIDLTNTKQITKEQGTIIVEFTVATAKVLKEMPSGWQGMVRGAWDTINIKIGPLIPSNLQLIWKLLDGLIRAL